MTSCCSVVLGGLGYAYLPARKPQKWDDVTLAEALTVPLTRGQEVFHYYIGSGPFLNTISLSFLS